MRTGKLLEDIDPYFSFGTSLERWGRSFAALGIQFRDAELTLDLVDRVGKYENGFMHGPELASPWLSRTLPLHVRTTRHAGLAVDLLYPAWALLWAVLAAAVAMQWSQAVHVAVFGSIIGVTAATLSRGLAQWTRDHTQAAAVTGRAAIIVGLALAPLGGP